MNSTNNRRIPVEDFFRNPNANIFRISPDGEYISCLKPYKSRMNIHVKKISTGTEFRITNAEDRSIPDYYWVNNSRIVFTKDNGGDENYRLYAVNTDGTDFMDLTPYEGVTVSLIDPLKNSDNEVLIIMNMRDKSIFDAYRINVYSGEMRMVAENPGDISEWIVDHNGDIRAAVCQDGVDSRVLYKKDVNDKFELIISGDYRENAEPICFDYENRNLLIASNFRRDKYAIYEFDPVKKENVKLIYEHDEVDVKQLLTSEHARKFVGVKFFTDRENNYFWDEEHREIFNGLQQIFKDCVISTVDKSLDENFLLLRVYSDIMPGSYFLYKKDNNELIKLEDSRPWINEDEMACMKPIAYKSRDGLKINGYLTIPRGMDLKNLPVIVNPHGGPWMRDMWEFIPEIQFMANRGYAVLNVNFRGSSGYGRKFKEASAKQWGRKMQDDITDGVQWLIDEGLADPDKIAIYGISFGGYSTLAGITFTPELYSCAVDVVGPSDISALVESIPPYWKSIKGMFYEMIGHPEEDREFLREISPLFHTDKIRTPLFVVQGGNDPRVKREQSERIVEALRSRGVEVKYLCKENEGHGFKNEENRIELYREMEAFLQKHIG